MCSFSPDPDPTLNLTLTLTLTLSLQDVKAAVKGVQPAGTLAGRTANSIHWSPHGRNLVLAGMKVGPRRRVCVS